MKIPEGKDEIPYITRAKMVEVDRLMTDEFNIPLLLMMENAGFHLAELTNGILGRNKEKKRVLVLCGAGNNGGGGMAAARHLLNRGISVSVAFAGKPLSLKQAPALQMQILKRMGVSIYKEIEVIDVDLIIDALIGYGLQGVPRGKVSRWIRLANQANTPILSLDIPSGLDADSGMPAGECVRASATMTLALPKIGMKELTSKKYLGDLYLADIGVPFALYKKIGIEVKNIYNTSPIVKI